VLAVPAAGGLAHLVLGTASLSGGFSASPHAGFLGMRDFQITNPTAEGETFTSKVSAIISLSSTVVW
jgi:hypothetical protein